MGDCAAGDEVRAGFGVGTDAVEIDASGEFDGCSAGDNSNPFFRLLRGEIVEEQVGRSAFERFVQLVGSADLDFYRESGLLRVRDRLTDAAGSRRCGCS